MRSPSEWVRRCRPPQEGLHRARWFYLVFTVFMLVTGAFQIPFVSPVPPAWWPGAVLAVGYLLWRRILEYRLGALQPPNRDVIEALAVFVVLLNVGPFAAGLGVLYASVFYRSVFGSALRAVLTCLIYLLALSASAWYAEQLSATTGIPWQQQVMVHVGGVLFSTFSLRVLLTTLLAHQRKLEENEKLLATVLDNIDTAVIAFDSAGLPVLRNQSALDLYAELSLPEPPQLWHEGATLYHRDGCAPMPVEDLPMWQVLRGQEVREQELTLGLPDGSYRSYMCSGQPLPSSDLSRPAGVLTVTEVTARVQAATRARELDRAKTDFVSTVSHELRTPLTSICGYVELMREEVLAPLPDELKSPVATIDRNAQRLLHLVQELLFLSGLDNNPTAAAPERLDLVELVELVGGIVVEARVVHAGRRIDFDGPDSLDRAAVLGVRDDLGRVVMNLVANALKFSPDGEVVTVALSVCPEALEIRVVDRGIGIPVEEQGRLFGRFFRSSLAQERAIPGTGLGLAICKAVVEAHAGSIFIDSRAGEGTTVRVRLPLAAAASVR